MEHKERELRQKIELSNALIKLFSPNIFGKYRYGKELLIKSIEYKQELESELRKLINPPQSPSIPSSWYKPKK